MLTSECFILTKNLSAATPLPPLARLFAEFGMDRRTAILRHTRRNLSGFHRTDIPIIDDLNSLRSFTDLVRTVRLLGVKNL